MNTTRDDFDDLARALAAAAENALEAGLDLDDSDVQREIIRNARPCAERKSHRKGPARKNPA